MMFNTVLGLSIDRVGQLVEFVPNFVHHLRIFTVFNIVAKSIARVIGMRGSIVPKFLIRLMVVIILSASQVRVTLVDDSVMGHLVTGNSFRVDLTAVILWLQPWVMCVLSNWLKFTLAKAVQAVVLVTVGMDILLVVWLEYGPVVRFG